MRTMNTFLLCAVTTALLTSCEIEDDLQIRPNGSGTYRARIVVERIVSPVLQRIRGEAEREGFRIVEEGMTFTSRYLVVRKDFTQIRALSGRASNFDLKIEQSYFRRRYRLHATLGAVSDESFERRFTITMPEKVTWASVGNIEGRRVTWYCSNGGTIEIVAEGIHLPLGSLSLTIAFAAACVVSVVVLIARRRQRTAPATITPPHSTSIRCRTCHQPIAPTARYCPSCGDVASG